MISRKICHTNSVPVSHHSKIRR